jgi:hypothetical protein
LGDECVGEGGESGHRVNLVAGQSLGVAGSVPAFVVLEGDGGGELEEVAFVSGQEGVAEEGCVLNVSCSSGRGGVFRAGGCRGG